MQEESAHSRKRKEVMKVKLRISGARSSGRTAHVTSAMPAVPRLQSILVPIDFSDESTRALRFASALAGPAGAKLMLLHVVEPIGTPDFVYYPMLMENERVVRTARERLEQLRVEAGIQSAQLGGLLVRNGVAFHEITGAAKLLKIDLIVIATHGYTGLKHILLGSTTERVVRHAPCPVLVVR
jgi:nucleotide-binding universal stress UspA family protein